MAVGGRGGGLDGTGNGEALDLAQGRDIPEPDGAVEACGHRYRLPIERHRCQGGDAAGVAGQHTVRFTVWTRYRHGVAGAPDQPVFLVGGGERDRRLIRRNPLQLVA